MLIGQRIRSLRQAKGLSQGDVEARTGLLRGYISRVEHGHTTPCVETLQRFAGALDVPLYMLFYNATDGQLQATAVRRLNSTLEEIAQSGGLDGSQARFLLRLQGLLEGLVASDLAILLDCARLLASR